MDRIGQADRQTITRLLLQWSDGSTDALDRLIPLVHTELHRIAERSLRREDGNHTFQPTDLVNEAFLKLFDQKQVEWQNRMHFFGIAANLMRRILVDHYRKQHADKRGGGATKVSIDSVFDLPELPGKEWSEQDKINLLALNQALEKLKELDPEKCSVVELRYFFGLSVEDTATAMNIAVSTVVRHWRWARAFLYRTLKEETPDGQTAMETDG